MLNAKDSNKEETRQTKNDLDAIVFLMFEALPNMKDGGIRGSLVKALKIFEENEVVASFKNDQYFVKSQSRPNAAPYIITVMQTGMIRCDTTCEKYQKEGFCSHCICVALKYNEIQRYTVALSHFQEKPLTNIASRNIQKDRVIRIVKDRRSQNELFARKVYLLQVLKSLKSKVFCNKKIIMESM